MNALLARKCLTAAFFLAGCAAAGDTLAGPSTTFQAVTPVSPASDHYAWSSPDNWTNGIPVDGGNVTIESGAAIDDDLPALTLDSLDLSAEVSVLNGSLTVETLNFGADLPGATSPFLSTASGTSLTIGTFTHGRTASSAGGGVIASGGPDSITTILAETDPIGTYVAFRGEVVLNAFPDPQSVLWFDVNAPHGTIALKAAGAVISSRIVDFMIGDSFAVPGTVVNSVTYGKSSLVIVTDAGTTTFDNVEYGGPQPNGFEYSLDAVSGLVRVTATWHQKPKIDLNGDGAADLVLQNADGSTAIWLMNGLSAPVGATILGPGTGWSVAKTGDFDGDGKTDLLWQHTDGRAAIWLMNGTTPVASAEILGPGGGWTAAEVVDVNHDGKADIIWRNVDGSVAVWLMNGTTRTSGATILGPGTGWSFAGIADLNGIGWTFYLWAHSDGRMAYWLMSGLTFEVGSEWTNPGAGWSLSQIANLDVDGTSDLVYANADGSAAISLSNPHSTWQQVIGPGTGWSVIGVGDFNHDGRQDLVWRNEDGRVAIWLMDGVSIKASAEILAPGTGWSVAAVTDIDGDGKADIVWQHTDGSIAAWLMDGTTMTGGATLLGPGSGWSVNPAK